MTKCLCCRVAPKKRRNPSAARRVRLSSVWKWASTLYGAVTLISPLIILADPQKDQLKISNGAEEGGAGGNNLADCNVASLSAPASRDTVKLLERLARHGYSQGPSDFKVWIRLVMAGQ